MAQLVRRYEYTIMNETCDTSRMILSGFGKVKVLSRTNVTFREANGAWKLLSERKVRKFRMKLREGFERGKDLKKGRI